MLRRRSIPRVAGTWLSLLVQLYSGLVFASGLLLCVARDGHTAVEAPHVLAPCRTDYTRHHSGPGNLALGAAADADHTCTDTVLIQPLVGGGVRSSLALSRAPSSLAAMELPPPPILTALLLAAAAA